MAEAIAERSIVDEIVELLASADASGCPAGTAGPACEFTDAGTCRDRGAALYDGSCDCDAGFGGTACNVTGEPECNGNGIVGADGVTCECFVNWESFAVDGSTGAKRYVDAPPGGPHGESYCYYCSQRQKALSMETEQEKYVLFYSLGAGAGIGAIAALGIVFLCRRPGNAFAMPCSAAVRGQQIRAEIFVDFALCTKAFDFMSNWCDFAPSSPPPPCQ